MHVALRVNSMSVLFNFKNNLHLSTKLLKTPEYQISWKHVWRFGFLRVQRQTGGHEFRKRILYTSF